MYLTDISIWCIYVIDQMTDINIDIATWLLYTIYIFEAAAVAHGVRALGWMFESKPRQT